MSLPVLDIISDGDYPANELSNFFPHEFILDGVRCASMEGFLQSLKFKSKHAQIKICALVGKAAKKKGARKFLWKLTGNLHWQGKKIKRVSSDFIELINRAYAAMFENARFKAALDAANGYTLAHSIGKRDPKTTVLTEREFLDCLERLRDEL